MPAITIQSVTSLNPGLGAAIGPTAVLNGPAPGQLTTILNYPMDLGSSTKQHYVKFWIKTIKPKDLVAVAQNAISSVGNFASEGISSGESIPQLLEKAASGVFKELNTLTVAPDTTPSAAYISLYMPDTVSTNYNASYDELSLTNDLGSGIKAIQFMSSVAGNVLNGNKGSKISNEAIDMAAVGAFSFASEGIQKAVSSATGYAINPQMQNIFRGVNFREFQLSFTFTPSSQAEAVVVNNIISTFRYHFAPDVLNPSSSNRGIFYTPPSLFNVEFMFGANENTYLPRYGDCVLTAIDVNFAPNGYAAHTDGAPVQTQLTLQFREIEIVTKAKLLAGATNITNNSGPYQASQGLR